MASTNVTVSSTWTQVSTVSCILTPNTIEWGEIQIATAETIPNETLLGRTCGSGESVVCNILPGEMVWAKSANGFPSINIVVDAIATTTGGEITQAIPDYESASDLLAAFGNFSEVNWAGGDFVSRVITSNGQTITALSANPLVPGESRIVIDCPVKQPCVLDFEGSVIRNRQQFVSAGLFADRVVDGLITPDPVPNPINIVSISQSSAVNGAVYTGTAGVTCTIVLESALPPIGAQNAVFLSDWINITGLVDTRLNYQNACINYISPDRKVVCFGYSDEVALPSLAVALITPAIGTAKVNFYNNAAGAIHGAGYRFTGTTDTSGVYWTIFGGGDAQVSGTLTGDHRTTIATSAATTLNQITGNYELKATSRFRVECKPEATNFLDRPIDIVGNHWTHRVNRTSVKPGSEAMLRPRFRLYQPPGMSRPIAKIVSISKAGTTTATANLDIAPETPIVVGNVLNVYGVRDQVGFPNAQATVTAVISPTQVQFVIGSATTVTSYGGFVGIVNGGAAQPGIISMVASTIKSSPTVVLGTANPEWLEIVMNTTISGLSAGMYINLHGWRNATNGDDMLVDGVWEIASVGTTTLIVMPVYDIRGIRQSPVTPTIATATNCGGAIIVRTTARLHDLIVTSSGGETEVRIAGQGSTRADLSVPVNLTASATCTQGTGATISTTDGTGGWPIRPSITGIADIASAAITTTATSSSIANDKGNGFQLNFPVTAVTGTSPTLDIRIEESFDGGTTFVTLYEMQRITAVGNYSTPILRATGRHIRYVRTITGTTPSFTMAATRNLLPFIQAEPQKRLMDRTIVPNTLNSVTPTLFSGAANNSQLVINMGAITTTAPQIQVEGSEDGTNWYAIGTPLLAVASATVEVTVAKSATFVRARVSTAGSGATLGYISLKAWS